MTPGVDREFERGFNRPSDAGERAVDKSADRSATNEPGGLLRHQGAYNSLLSHLSGTGADHAMRARAITGGQRLFGNRATKRYVQRQAATSRGTNFTRPRVPVQRRVPIDMQDEMIKPPGHVQPILPFQGQNNVVIDPMGQMLPLGEELNPPQPPVPQQPEGNDLPVFY